LAFDGIAYRNARYLYPSSYQAGAGFTAAPLSNTLRAAYYQARTHARLLMTQTYGHNSQNPGGTVDAGLIVNETALARIADNWCYIGPEYTHIVFSVIFGVYPAVTSAVYHTGYFDDGTNPVVSQAADTINAHNTSPLSQPAPLGSRGRIAQTGRYDYGRLGIYRATTRLKLDSISLLDQVSEIYVAAYAARASDTTAVPYKPFAVTAWAEVIG
tara:strand:+ start:3970 stop:4611 length:642 start_codon:yes stop_codon:yes gene_type:complete